jgi:hypothetical protein
VEIKKAFQMPTFPFVVQIAGLIDPQAKQLADILSGPAGVRATESLCTKKEERKGKSRHIPWINFKDPTRSAGSTCPVSALSSSNSSKDPQHRTKAAQEWRRRFVSDQHRCLPISRATECASLLPSRPGRNDSAKEAFECATLGAVGGSEADVEGIINSEISKSENGTFGSLLQSLFAPTKKEEETPASNPAPKAKAVEKAKNPEIEASEGDESESESDDEMEKALKQGRELKSLRCMP